MEREQMFREWLPRWKPKNAGANFTGNVWSESTLSSYTNVLKNISYIFKTSDFLSFSFLSFFLLFTKAF